MPLRHVLLSALLSVSIHASFAQSQPSISDSAQKGHKSSDLDRGKFPWKGLIVPTVLTGYGFIAIHNSGLQEINRNIQKRIWEDNPHGMNHLDDYLRFAPVVAVYGLNLAGVKGKNDLRDRTMILAISTLIMGGSVYTLKHVVKEPLPFKPDSIGYKSFPSGHAAEAFMAAEFMWQEYKGRSPWYGIAGYACAAATGYLRLYNNQHWFSDVVAGAGIGIGSAKLAYWIYPKIKKALFKDKKVNTLVLPYYRSGAVGLQWVSRF
jgi:hypothetical protein